MSWARARWEADAKARSEAEARAKREAEELAKRQMAMREREAELKKLAAEVSRRKVPIVPIAIAFLVVVVGAVGAWYWSTSSDEVRVAALTAALDAATKATQELDLARQRQAELSKRVEQARLDEDDARVKGDQAKLKQLQLQTQKAEAEAQKQNELVKQRETEVKKAEDAAKIAEAKRQTDVTKAVEKAAQEKVAKEKAAQEQAAQEKAQIGRLAMEKEAADKVAADRAAADKLAAQKSAAEKVKQMSTEKGNDKAALAIKQATDTLGICRGSTPIIANSFACKEAAKIVEDYQRVLAERAAVKESEKPKLTSAQQAAADKLKQATETWGICRGSTPIVQNSFECREAGKTVEAAERASVEKR